MTNKEKARKELEEIKARTAELERIINEPEIEYYEVKTPVSIQGNILFNNNKQLLSVNDGVYNVDGNSRPYDDYKENYVWIPCQRDDLKAGDTAYRTDSEDKDFTTTPNVCKIISKFECVFVTTADIRSSTVSWEYWYKLVKRKELGL